MREIVHIQAGQCGNQIGAKVKIQPFYTHLQNYHFCQKKSAYQKLRNFGAKIVT